MYYTEEIQLNEAKILLESCGLTMPKDVDYTVGIFTETGHLAATGSLKGDMIQGIAVDPQMQGEDLTGKVLTHLLQHARDTQVLYLFTKPEKTMQFAGLGFRTVAKARPYAALLEWGKQGISAYQESLKQEVVSFKKKDPVIGALVMNCNPFTRGHRYLIEQAAAKCDHVYVLVVEENLSRFSFHDRFQLVKEGTKDLEYVTVLPGGRYAVSTLTFPSYFTKEELVAEAHAAIDAELFCTVIAPVLGVTVRFVGTEPYETVTRVYNETLKSRLPKHGIEVVEVPRLEDMKGAVSASRVRSLIDTGGEEAWKEIKQMVPASTYAFLEAGYRKVTLMELLDSREQRALKQQELLKRFEGTLISMTLNIPGPVKDRPVYRRALQLAMERVEKAVEPAVILYQEICHQFTGSVGYLVIDGLDGYAVKQLTVAIEDSEDVGRLFDLDVMTKKGVITRSDLGLSGRPCLICDEEAKVCARSQKHPMTELQQKIDEILKDI